MELCHADSAGISILEPGGTSGMLRWHAAAGGFAANLHGIMPREASPCGTVMERDRVLLSHEAERFFPALRGVEPRIYENLLAPWHVKDEALGTLWAIRHTPEGRFDAEDARVLQSLARFAAAAFQMTSALDEAKADRTELERPPGPYTRVRPGSSPPSISLACRPTPGIRPPVRWSGMPGSRPYGGCPRMLMSTTRSGYPAFMPRIALRSRPRSRIVSTPQVTGSTTSSTASSGSGMGSSVGFPPRAGPPSKMANRWGSPGRP